MEKVNRLGVLWWCIWNKAGKPELADEWRSCLMTGMELQAWIHSHRDWWRIGKWNEERYASPVRLTPAGRKAITQREKYDAEDVEGGLVEPGFIVSPTPKTTKLLKMGAA